MCIRDSWETWIYKGLIFIIVACPCALAVAAPLAFLGGIASAARQGIVVKGGNFLESLVKACLLYTSLKGEILRIPDQPGLKIPHMGWNSLKYPNEGRLFRGIPEDSYVYFVHSYYLKSEDESIVTATTEYSTLIHASVESGNVFACQFHPEKSSDVGIQLSLIHI